MAASVKPVRIVVWSTGGVGSIAIDAIRRRPDLELVGVWVHSEEKDGQDAGELAGGTPTGLMATHDADALIALNPTASSMRPAGPNAMPVRCPTTNGCSTPASTSYQRRPPACCIRPRTTPPNGETARGRCEGGRPSFYVSGIFPGFGSDQLALLLSTQSKTIQCITVTEVALNDHYPVADVMMDGMGFGHPLDFEPMLKTPASSSSPGRLRSG